MNIFNSIKSRVDIVQVINDYTTLKRAGIYWKGHCPFHHERTPSFTVTPHKSIFYCFGCHEGGDVIAFIAKAENCSQLEAARYIAERYHIDLPAEINMHASEQHIEERRRYHNLHEMVASWCTANLQKYGPAMAYVTQRNITPAIRETFNLGYFPTGQNAIKQLLQAVKREQFLANDLLAAKIILEGKHGLYSPFEDRIMFPIKDHMGNTCGFGGRIFRDQDTRAKYYNSHDHMFFNKGSLLFGFNLAKKQAQTKNNIFLVEGYTDCIAMVQAGFINTVATLGTACSLEHLHLLSRYAQSLYIVYDGDAAGNKAILRLSELCWATNMELFIITLPEQEDPASYLSKDCRLEPLIQGAKTLFAWYLDHTSNRLHQATMSDKIVAIKELLALIAKVTDPLKQELLLQQAATACSIPLQALQRELRSENKKQPEKNNGKTQGKKPYKKSFELEKQLFCVILNNNEFISGEDEAFLIQALPEPLASIFKQLQEFKRGTPQEEFSTFFNTLTHNEQEIVSKFLIQLPSEQDSHQFSKLLEQLQKKQWKIMVNDVKIKLADAQQAGDVEGMQRIIAEFQSFKQKMFEKGLL